MGRDFARLEIVVRGSGFAEQAVLEQSTNLIDTVAGIGNAIELTLHCDSNCDFRWKLWTVHGIQHDIGSGNFLLDLQVSEETLISTFVLASCEL